MEASPLKERSQAIDNVGVVIGKQDGGVLAGHLSGL
jgi:hypothetical protein